MCKAVNIVLLLCIQSLTTSNACGVGNHDEHFYVRFFLFSYSVVKFIVVSCYCLSERMMSQFVLVFIIIRLHYIYAI